MYVQRHDRRNHHSQLRKFGATFARLITIVLWTALNSILRLTKKVIIVTGSCLSIGLALVLLGISMIPAAFFNLTIAGACFIFTIIRSIISELWYNFLDPSEATKKGTRLERRDSSLCHGQIDYSKYDSAPELTASDHTRVHRRLPPSISMQKTTISTSVSKITSNQGIIT